MLSEAAEAPDSDVDGGLPLSATAAMGPEAQLSDAGPAPNSEAPPRAPPQQKASLFTESESGSLLAAAVRGSNRSALDHLLQLRSQGGAGLDVGAGSHRAVRTAAAAGDVGTVCHLVEVWGADVRARGDEALRMAALRGDVGVVRVLIERCERGVWTCFICSEASYLHCFESWGALYVFEIDDLRLILSKLCPRVHSQGGVSICLSE